MGQQFCAAVLATLIKYRAKIDVIDAAGRAPLSYAANARDSSILKTLLLHRANVHAADSTTQETPLHHAVQSGHKANVDVLLKEGAASNVKTAMGKMPLHYVPEGRESILDLLCKSRADVNARDNEGQTLLLQAVARGGQTLLESLLQNRADTNIAD